MVYKERMKEMALGTGMLGYSPSKSKKVILMGMYEGQCLKARLALWIAVSVSRHIVLIEKVKFGYFAKRLKYNSFRTLFMT
jgi:hypothetical protein